MSSRVLTRRSLLTGAAGTLAGVLTRPVAALALLAGTPRPTVTQRLVGDLAAGELTLSLPANADLVGLGWQAPPNARLRLRYRTPGGSWSQWLTVAATSHGPDTPTGGSMAGDPIWTGGTRRIQLRCSMPVSGVRLYLVDVSAGAGARRQAIRTGLLASLASLPAAAPVLAAGPGQPPIIARAAWAQGVCHPRVAPEYGTVQLAFVHHSDNPNGYLRGEVPAMLRAIFAFHRYVNGWNDIGYNFVIDRFGRTFEARAGGIDEPVVGAHAGGYNVYSSGIAVLGTYTLQRISAQARRSLTDLLAWKLALHGAPTRGRVSVRVTRQGAVYSRFPAGRNVSLPRIAGHRDADSTDCPGQDLYDELPALRGRAHTLAGRPVRVSMSLSEAVDQTQSAVATLTGGLAFRDGQAPATAIPAAALLIQVRAVSQRGELVRESTIAQAITDANGQWSLALYPPSPQAPELPEGSWLRALYQGSDGISAAVSESLRLPFALSLIPAASQTPAPGLPG